MALNSRFEKLLEPAYIGSVKLRNRIIKTGAANMYWRDDELHMNNITKAYYEALARGGSGLVVVVSPAIDYPLGVRWHERYRLDDDKYIEGISELVEVMHKHGCPTFMQMQHDGPWQSPIFEPPPLFEGPPIGASPVNLPVPGDFHRDVPRELTIPEIEDIVDKFASAAVRAKKAGFEGVDINAGSSHLLHNFLSPYWNRRQDDYGGSRENRTRFLVSIIKEIKNRAGQDFPVVICMNGIEVGQAIDISNDECMTAEDSRQIALILQGAGADAIHLRNHWLGYHVGGFLPDQLFYPEPPVPLKSFPKEYDWSRRGAAANVLMAAEMKKILSIPVILVGRLGPELGEKILREGKADFIAMHRRLMADPELPNKVAEGRLEDIAPCTACGTCLDQSVSMARHCRINAALGTENYTIEKAEKRKKVVVIGGGPAGMEAARVAALRGHEVILYERSGRLGGLLPMAALVKGTEIEDLPGMVRYLRTQINKLSVKTMLGIEADVSTIEEVKPDAVIVAVGGITTIPDIIGINKRNVISSPALHRMLKSYLRFLSPQILRWLTRFWMPVGKRVVIIGGGLHGCEVAEFLVKRNKKVTIVDTAEVLGEGMVDYRLGLLLDWFEKKGVTTMTGLKDIEITDRGVVITARDGDRQTIEADSIIPAVPLTSNAGLLESLEGKAPEIYAIGDCKEPGKIVDAIADGWRVVRQL